MTELVLLRHGHVAWHDPERFRGRAELELSGLGERQARATALHLAATRRPDVLYSSPLSRCRATAAAVAAPFRLPVATREELADIDYGAWQGLTREEAAARWPEEIDRWFRVPHLAAIPGGETLAAVAARAGAALTGLLRRHAGQRLVVVAHDSVNRVLLLQALELPLSRYWQLRQDPCNISTLSFDDNAFVVRSLNETQHLAGLG